MHVGDHRTSALLDRLRARPAVADADDDTSWDDLGLLVGLLMQRSLALPLGKAPTTHPVREIFHYWDEPEPPADVAACMASWRRAGVPVRHFDREEVDEWLQRHFGADVLAAFRYVHHPSMQSDIFRMARLHQAGGLYVDADDLFTGDGPIPAFQAGSALLPLAVCRTCPVSLVPRADDARASLAWYYLGSAPWFSTPGHPFVARSLERAVSNVLARKQRGERCSIHNDVGPGCVSMAALDHVRDCLRRGSDWDLNAAPGWTFVEQSQWLGYKATERNWRTDSALYGPDGLRPGEPA